MLQRLCHDFPSKIFCLTVPKNFVVELFCAVFQKNSGSEKKLWVRGRGKYRSFFEIILSGSARNFVREPFLAVFQEISGSQNFMDKRGGGSIKFFRRKFLNSKCRKKL